MRRFGTDFINDLFFLLLAFFLLAVAAVIFTLSGDQTAAFLVSYPGVMLVMATAFFLYGIGKARWISTDWIVDKISERRIRKEGGQQN
jgi:hypothetical protein